MIQLDYNGRVALVTGATRGIGAQIADDLEELGAKLILTGTSPQAIHALQEAHPGRDYRVVDFLDEESTHAFMESMADEPRIDVLINNAGINRINPIDQSKAADWEAIYRVNLRAPVLLVRAVTAGMRESGYGRVVNIGSIFGVVSKEQRAFYSTTKFGLHGLTVATALDLARVGILVNTVSPGFVLTDLTRSILSEDQMEELASEVPLGRFADPAEISRVVTFLASEMNSYITAQNIIVDGGFVSA